MLRYQNKHLWSCDKRRIHPEMLFFRGHRQYGIAENRWKACENEIVPQYFKCQQNCDCCLPKITIKLKYDAAVVTSKV